MTSMQERYDLVIVGSGSTAFAAALHAAELGKSAVMAEFRTVGGTCVNRGCLPSKNLIEAARLVYDAAHPRYPGLTPVHMPFNWAELVAQKDEIIQEYRTHKYESLLDDPDHMQVVPGQARLVSDHEVEIQSAGGARRGTLGRGGGPPAPAARQPAHVYRRTAPGVHRATPQYRGARPGASGRGGRSGGIRARGSYAAHQRAPYLGRR